MSEHATSTEAGTLYLVGTPIGNLEDVTLRALRVLAEVEVIAAEDTRVTRRLLERHGIDTPLVSHHQHSGRQRTARLLRMLREGKRVALVCDAGMPGISDPGARLVRACAREGVPMVAIPGPSAAVAALALSGLVAREFVFVGFLPSRPAARRKALKRVRDQLGAIVCFEAPSRLLGSLGDLRDILGDREAMCGRELTKRFEEIVRGRLSDLIAHFATAAPRGELTLVVAGSPASSSGGDLADAADEVRDLTEAGLPLSKAVSHVARRRRLPRRDLYRAAMGGTGEEA